VDNDQDDDEVCDADEVEGCQDATACNYMALATDEDGTCIYAAGCETCSGATDGTGTIVDNDQDADGVCDADEIDGCMDSSACNYQVGATDDDNSCWFVEEFYDCASDCITDTDGDGVCDELEIEGCMNGNACNFNPDATDEGACEFAIPFHDCNGDCLNDVDDDGVCDEIEVLGCTNDNACNFNQVATENDGSCTYPIAYYECDGSCTDDADGDGVCDVLEVFGCDDPEAWNFESFATENDGSCLEEDPLITAYNDGYYAGQLDCIGGPEFCGEGTVWSEDSEECLSIPACLGDLNEDEVRGTSDLLLLLGVYGLMCDD
jgi:hypothetical protein